MFKLHVYNKQLFQVHYLRIYNMVRILTLKDAFSEHGFLQDIVAYKINMNNRPFLIHDYYSITYKYKVSSFIW